MNLRQTATRWEFEREEALEDFLFLNLHEVLGLTALARQYIVQGQRCDILAIDSTKRLVVLELKNIEDRGIVQQLTRYYHALLDEKPFLERINYDLPVHLIAIAPSFHRDNWIDRKYHRLEFQFLEFFILQQEDQFYFNLKDLDQNQIFQIKILYQQQQQGNLPSPPTALLKLLKGCDVKQQEKILQIREKILRFDQRMQEFVASGSILYGNGNGKTSKYCAEFCYGQEGNALLFLWIPLKCGESSRIGRARIWTDWDDQALIEGYVSTGVGTEINRSKRSMKSLMNSLRKEHNVIYHKIFDFYYQGKNLFYFLKINSTTDKKYLTSKSRVYKAIEQGKPITKEDLELTNFERELILKQRGITIEEIVSPYKSLGLLIDLALEKWLSRL